MTDIRLRQAIALEAARLMYERVETEYFTAKRKAAKRLCRQGVKPEDLPSNAEIRDQVQTFARIHEGERRTRDLRDMRLEALRMMRLLRPFRPRLIGSVMTGHVRQGSDIDLHVFCDSPALITDLLQQAGAQFDVERKQVVKHGESRIFTHVHVFDRFNFELTVYDEDKAHYVFKSSITGKAIERASIAELEELLAREYPDLNVDEAIDAAEADVDPYPLFRLLLLPLENVKGPAAYHPEGDVLYHSLQVFEQAREHRAYDEEFLLAALLHDVGKGLDPGDHVQAGLEALDGLITDRTRWLIEHHMEAHDYRRGTLPGRLRRELETSPDFEDLLLLRECDDAGRVPGAIVGTVDEALDYLRELERKTAMVELLAGYPVVVEQAVVWGEMDSYRHVNNVVYFRYFENARLEYFRRLDWAAFEKETGVGPILHSTRARFRRPLKYPDTIFIAARVASLAEDRFTLEHRIVSKARQEVVTEGEGVVVTYDHGRGEKVPIPAELVRRIRELEGGGVP